MKPQNIKAIIYDKRGRVISIGQNQYDKSHPYQAQMAASVGMPDRIFLHAEVHAIVRCRDISKADTIFVSRWDKKGNAMMAKPCKICMSAIRASGIRHVQYTTGHGNEVVSFEVDDE